LKARFPSFLYGMWFRDEKMYSTTFSAGCILHNVCLSFRDSWSKKLVRETMKVLKEQKKLYRRAMRTVSRRHKVGGSLEDGRVRRKAVMEQATGSKEG
jgi:hypothetical protein